MQCLLCIADLEFSGVPFNLTFTNESKILSANISILDDSLVEQPEVIILALTILTPGMILGSGVHAQVDIFDDDGM